MCVCTLRLAITLDIKLFSIGIIEKYPSYCIIAWVLMCLVRPKKITSFLPLPYFCITLFLLGSSTRYEIPFSLNFAKSASAPFSILNFNSSGYSGMTS